MSADEDTELRDLVAQTLESNGVLGKIRAQLRASVFLALEEQESIQNKTPLQNPELKKFMNTKEGRIVTGLVREFLEYFNLEFTTAVFDPETGGGEHYEGRNNLARDLNIIESDTSTSLPLLAEVVKRCSDDNSGPSQRGRVGSVGTETNSSSSMTSSSTVESKNKKNAEERSQSNNVTTRSKNSPRDDFFGSDPDDDAFFDEPVPANDRSKSFQASSDKGKDGASKGASSMSSLAGLPALGGGPDSKEPDMDVKGIDKKMSDLGFDVPDDDDYDDDFESSNISPVGHTPRSQKSDHNVKSIDEDDIDEDIDEELSVGEDLLKSDNSGMDDLTTDRTVSPTDQSHAFDYIEDVLT